MSVSDARLGHLVRWGLIYTGIWTIPVILGTAGHFFGQMVEGRGMPPSHVFGHSFAMWYVWIPATPLILAVNRRLPFSRASWPAATFAHVGIVGVVFLLQTWATLVVGHATGHITPDVGFTENLTMVVVNLLLYDLLIYGCVIAVGVAADISKRYRDRDLRASQLETQLERARLSALQSQLQPHFLFNALNSVAMLVRRDRKDEALGMVIGFSELLRYVLDEAGTIDVPLEEELSFVRRYLEIEQVRHRERLRVEFRIQPEAAKALVPNLVLQPLVENAIKHGISHLPEGGAVIVVAERRGETLHLSVENDGPALAADFSVDESPGVGLRNLRERLAALVGPTGHVTLAPAAVRTGTLAVVELPFRSAMTPAPARAMEKTA
jgi:two-component system LytT family sensor kinase